VGGKEETGHVVHGRCSTIPTERREIQIRIELPHAEVQQAALAVAFAVNVAVVGGAAAALGAEGGVVVLAEDRTIGGIDRARRTEVIADDILLLASLLLFYVSV
jgi:hypothetical protein